jgi:hypothetical protein
VITCVGTPGFFGNSLVRLGDQDDSAWVSNIGADRNEVSGGHGNDHLYVGSWCTATAFGDDGDDTMVVSGDCASIARGGYGDDRVAGGFDHHHDFRGGPGDDLLVPYGYMGTSEAYGEGDRDRIVQDRRAVAERVPAARLDGGAGGDIIVGIATVISGDSGADTIVAEGYHQSSVTAGDDWDVIDVNNGPTPGGDSPRDTVNCGKGVDYVYADPEDDVAANCEEVVIGAAPALPGVAEALADSTAIPYPDPASAAS